MTWAWVIRRSMFYRAAYLAGCILRLETNFVCSSGQTSNTRGSGAVIKFELQVFS